MGDWVNWNAERIVSEPRCQFLVFTLVVRVCHPLSVSPGSQPQPLHQKVLVPSEFQVLQLTSLLHLGEDGGGQEPWSSFILPGALGWWPRECARDSVRSQWLVALDPPSRLPCSRYLSFSEAQRMLPVCTDL